MLIYNVKLNKKVILKTILAIMFIIVIAIGISGLYSLLDSATENTVNDTIIPTSEVAKILPENYTNILKATHNDIDTYIGQKISFSGYVYRVSGFNEDQFVLARDMDIGNKQTLIVGFLCLYDKALNFNTYSWVDVTGEITKGTYNDETIPILKILDIKQIEKPENPEVLPPSDEYVPTAVIY